MRPCPTPTAGLPSRRRTLLSTLLPPQVPEPVPAIRLTEQGARALSEAIERSFRGRPTEPAKAG